MPPRGPQRRRRRALAGRQGRQPRVQQSARQPEQGVEDEHGLQRCQSLHTDAGQEVGASGHQRADRRRQGADQAVACECLRALLVLDALREGGMLEGYEHAHAAGRRVDGAGEGGDEDQRIVADRGKRKTAHKHQRRGRHQQPAVAGARSDKAHPDRHQRRAEQGSRCDETDLDRIETQRSEIHRQQHGDEAVAEVAHCASKVEPRDWRDGVAQAGAVHGSASRTIHC